MTSISTVAATESYIAKYYPTLITEAWGYQEGLRTQSAQGWGRGGDRETRGWTALDDILALLKDNRLPAKFREFIEKQTIPEETKHNNVRRIVKEVWSWPVVGYIPWTPLSERASAAIIPEAQNIIRRINPTLQLIGGKIYIVLTGFVTELWRKFPDLGASIPGLARPLVANTDIEHISVISSDLVPEDKAAVGDWLRGHNLTKVTVSDLKHTISLEWAPFSICLVVGLECEGLVAFVDDYNKQFGTKARLPSAHITVAVDYRAAPHSP